jgi:ATP-dependent Clp protease adaptor protein ClpS
MVSMSTSTKDVHDAEVAEKPISKVKEPKKYKVVLYNDNYTTMDFVVSILQTIFQRTPAEAVQIMFRVHREGKGVAGIYTRQVAEAKIKNVHQRARLEGYPLLCDLEAE